MMEHQDTSIRIAMVGDIALGNHPKTPGFGFYSRYKEGIPSSLAKRILPLGCSPHVVFGNLEFPLAADARHSGTDACCLGATKYSQFLRQAGFTVLNVANNHAWDYGDGVFEETVRSLQKAGIKVVGLPGDFDPMGFIREKGRVIAFLGCSARPRQGFTATPAYNEFDREDFIDRIREARRHSDLVCVSIHWGEEFVLLPSSWERDVARAMIDAGASIIVGHHPHVLREIETYRGGIIAYSLGNFIGDMSWNPLNRETGCLVVEADGGEICSSSFHPAMIEADFFPRYLGGPSSRQALCDQEIRRSNLESEMKAFTYEFSAKKALRTHQWLTILFFLKNIFKYKPTILLKILSHGIKVRFQKSE